MGLNIKDPETYRLIQELSELTGQSMTGAVTEAARERLERVRSAHGIGLAERLLNIGKDCAAHLNEPFKSMDHGHHLYDDLLTDRDHRNSSQ